MALFKLKLINSKKRPTAGTPSQSESRPRCCKESKKHKESFKDLDISLWFSYTWLLLDHQTASNLDTYSTEH